MRKIITISGKEYTMQSSAWTQFKYKNDTGRRMLQDLRDISKLQDADEDTLNRNIIKNGLCNDRGSRSKPS